MYCNQCGKELSEREKFCTGCGAAVKKMPEKDKLEGNTIKDNMPEHFADKTLVPKNAGRKSFRKRAAIAVAAVLILVVGVFLYVNTKNTQNKTDPKNSDALSDLVGQVAATDFNPEILPDTTLNDSDTEAIAESIERGFNMFGNEFIFSNESAYHNNSALFYHVLNYYWSQSYGSNANSRSVCVKGNSSASDSSYQWEAQAVDAYLRDEYGIEIEHSLNTEAFGEIFTYQDGYYFGKMEGIGGGANYSLAKMLECKELSKDILFVSFVLEEYIFEAELGPEEFSFAGTFSGNAILQKNEGSTIFPYRLLKLSVDDNTLTSSQPNPMTNPMESNLDVEAIVQSIRDRYSETQNNLDNCEVEYFGTSADAYYLEGRLVLLHELPCENLDIGYFPEGECDERWYYDNGEVFFIFRTDANTGEEYRLYFDDGELIRWIDPNGNIYDSDYRWDEMQGFYEYAKKQCDTYAIKGER